MPAMPLDDDKRRDSKREDAHYDDLTALSPELDRELRKLEHMFTVDAAKLKEISLQFEHELRQGLSRVSRCLLPSLESEGGNLPMLPTWVLGFPSGHECGEYLTIDLGGTKLRICWVTLNEGKGENQSDQEIYHIPKDYKVGTADQLWSFLAESMEDFMTKRHIEPEEGTVIPLGFTFSYPATQEYIDQGVLQTWTKGFDIKGVEGHDVADQLRQALHKRGLPIQIVALINDTVGAMIASAYSDPKTIMGAIFGTGCNASYMENCGSIAKLGGLPENLPMAINCEYGAFDNDRRILPRTPYDKTIDKESPRPGEQTFEKMSAGMYLGEIFRQVLVDLHSRGLLFKNQDPSKLLTPFIIKTGFLANIEDDASPSLTSTHAAFTTLLALSPTAAERLFVRRAAALVATRGARLCTAGVSAICRKKDISVGHVAADPLVYNNARFKARWAQAMAEVFDWDEARDEDPIVMTAAADGSGLGAAVISAMTLERVARGDATGLRPE